MQVKDMEAFLKLTKEAPTHIVEAEWKKIWEWFVSEKEKEYAGMTYQESVRKLISEKNYNSRRKVASSVNIGIDVKPGDICYIDFGLAYLYEAGYQHFGLVLNVSHYKALVIPMTSNPTTYQKSLDPEVEYLFPLGSIKGLYKESVLFLNDTKFINTARIIDVKAHIDPSSALFLQIKKRLKKIMID